MVERLVCRHPRLLLVAYCLLCWLPGLFSIPATDRDEARFAQASKQMLETGDYIDIRNGAEARNRKPIGIHWLQAPFAAAADAAGLARDNPVWPYRMPSVLGGLAAVLVTEALGRRLFDRRTAWLAAAMLAGCTLLTVEAHIAKTDAALLGATTLAMVLLGRCYLAPGAVSRFEAVLFWAALAVGVLLKGPITPMVAGLAAGTLVLCDRRAGWLRALRPALGVPLALALVLPWFVLIERATHGQFLAQAAGGDLARKVAGGDDAHGAPPGYHLLLLSFTLFPAGFAVLRALPAAWRARGDPRIRFLLAWIGPAWLVFEATPTKLPHYPLPVFPALCLLGAQWATAGGQSGRWMRRVSGALSVAAGCTFGIGAAVLPLVVGRAGHAGSDDLIGVPALIAASLVLGLMWRPALTRRAALVSGLAAAPLLWWSVLAWELPAALPLWTSHRVALAFRGTPGALIAVGYAEPSLMFEDGTQTRYLDASAAARALGDGQSARVAVASPQLPAFLAAAPPGLAALGPLTGFDYSNGRHVVLHLFAQRQTARP